MTETLRGKGRVPTSSPGFKKGGLPQAQELGPQLLLSRPFQHRLEAPDARLHGAGRRSLAGTPVQGPTGKSQGPRMRRSRNRSKGSRSSRQRIWRAKEAPRGPPYGSWPRGRRRQPRPNLPRCNLELREHSACLLMGGEQEIVDWLEEEVWKDKEGARTQVMEGFSFRSIEQWAKRLILTVSAEEQVNTFLEVMRKEGERGRLWPGLEGEVRVKAEAMANRSIVITVMDVAPETEQELVRRAMEKFGTMKRCERMTLPAPYNRVEINEMKVELVRNGEKLPNIIRAFGTANSADKFLV